jgi:hypothetical protein
MPINRTTIIRGPARISFNSEEFYSKDDITVRTRFETFDIGSSMFGKVDERVREIISEVSFTPVGEIEALATLFPYQPSGLGSSVFGGTDKALVIRSTAGQTITYPAAAITRMPTLTLSAVATVFGNVTFTCIGKNNEAWSAADHRIAIASQVYANSGFSPSAIITQPYTVTWGATTFETVGGVTIDISAGMDNVTVDSEGIVDMTLQTVTATARMQPLGLTETQLLTAAKVQGAGAGRGKSLGNGASNLVVAGTRDANISVTLTAAAIKEFGFNFGSSTLRAGEVQFVANQTFVGGAPNALYTITGSAS